MPINLRRSVVGQNHRLNLHVFSLPPTRYALPPTRYALPPTRSLYHRRTGNRALYHRKRACFSSSSSSLSSWGLASFYNCWLPFPVGAWLPFLVVVLLCLAGAWLPFIVVVSFLFLLGLGVPFLVVVGKAPTGKGSQQQLDKEEQQLEKEAKPQQEKEANNN